MDEADTQDGQGGDADIQHGQGFAASGATREEPGDIIDEVSEFVSRGGNPLGRTGPTSPKLRSQSSLRWMASYMTRRVCVLIRSVTL